MGLGRRLKLGDSTSTLPTGNKYSQLRNRKSSRVLSSGRCIKSHSCIQHMVSARPDIDKLRNTQRNLLRLLFLKCQSEGEQSSRHLLKMIYQGLI